MSQQSDTTARTALAATQTASTILHQTLSDHSQRGSLGWAKRIAGIALTGLSLSLLASGKAEAVSFTFEKIVDGSTPIPGGTGTFNSFSAPSLDNGNVAFEGSGRYSNEEGYFQSGIYTNIGGKLNVVADINTPIPGGTGDFDGFLRPSLDNGNVAFEGYGGYFEQEDYQPGIYTNIGGRLNVVADINTPIPGGTGDFDSLLGLSLDNGNVAFEGYGGYFDAIDYQSGIYTNIGGVLTEVISDGDSLDGNNMVSGVSLGTEGLSGNQIAFGAVFTDGSRGIYIATVPEPSSVLGTLAFSAFGAGWLLKCKLKKQKSVS